MDRKVRSATLVGLWILLGILLIVCLLAGVILTHPVG